MPIFRVFSKRILLVSQIFITYHPHSLGDERNWFLFIYLFNFSRNFAKKCFEDLLHSLGRLCNIFRNVMFYEQLWIQLPPIELFHKSLVTNGFEHFSSCCILHATIQNFNFEDIVDNFVPSDFHFRCESEGIYYTKEK